MTQLLINTILHMLLATTELPDGVINYEAKLKDPNIVCHVNLKGKNLKCDWEGELDNAVLKDTISTISTISR